MPKQQEVRLSVRYLHCGKTLKLERCLHGVAFAYVASVAVMLLGIQPFPILHDYAEWMFQGWLLQSILAGQPDSVYQLASWPVPNSLSQFALAALNIVVEPITAGKIWLAMYLLLGTFCFYRAARLCWPDYSGAIHLILIATILLGPGFWNGYINYQVGVVLLLVGWIGFRRGGRAGWLLFVSLAIFFAHAATYIALVVAVGVVVLTGRHMRSGVRVALLLALVPSLVLMAWYLGVKLATSAASLEDPLNPVQWLQYKAYTVAKQGPFHNFVLIDGSSALQNWHWVYLAGALINGLMLLVVALWFASLLWQMLRRRVQLSEPFNHYPMLTLLLLTAAWLLLFLLPGRNNFGVVNLGERFLIPLLGFALLAFACSRYLRAVWSGLCVVAAVCVVTTLIVVSRLPVTAYQGPDSDIYSASRHKYFNHRLFIYADRGLFLQTARTSDLRPAPDPQLATGPLILQTPL